jgi:RecA/RadA recombinase
MQQISPLPFISTGSKEIDALLGGDGRIRGGGIGGIRAGFVTDVYGSSGSGKTQLCFTLCANCARAGGRAMFIDTAGTFRPERIVEIAGAAGSGNNSILDKITFLRALSSEAQVAAVRKARQMDLQLLVVDTLTSLFSAEYSGPARHLAVMSHLHDLAVFAITSGCAVVVTNMVRTAPAEQSGKAAMREYLASSVSIYSHAKMRLEAKDMAAGQYSATVLQPHAKGGPRSAQFSITQQGISDKS